MCWVERMAWGGMSNGADAAPDRVDGERTRLVDDILARLAQGSHESRLLIARHPRAPVAVLDPLAFDPDSKVRLIVAMNPGSSDAARQRLVNDPEGTVRAGLAENPVPTDLLQRLASDSESLVRERVADNPRTPAETLERMASDSDPDVSAAARQIQHPCQRA